MLTARFLTAFCISIFLFADANAEPQIRLNQLGFTLNAPKSAIVFSHDPLPDEFRLMTVDGSVVFKGRVNPIAGSWGEFNHHAELFRATKDARYLRDGKRYGLLAREESWMGKDEAGHYQYYPFMNIGHFRLYDLVDARTKQQLAAFYREEIERCLKKSEGNPYRIGVPFIWCSNNLVVALATECLLYERMTGDRRYREFTFKQIDWLLGRNPWGTSMFTGIPTNGVYPKDVHLFRMRC